MANLDDNVLARYLEAQVLHQGQSYTVTPDAEKAKQHLNLAIYVAGRRLKRNDALGERLFSIEVELKIQAVNLTPPDDPSLVLTLLLAVDTLLERYQTRNRVMQDLSLAVEFVERVDRIIGQSHELLSDHLLNYGRAHLSLFEADPTTSLDTTINKFSMFPHVVNNHPELLQLYGTLLLRRFRSAANINDLRIGIRQAERALELPNADVDTQIYALTNITEFNPFLFEFAMGDVVTHLDIAVERGLRAKDLVQQQTCNITDASFVYGALAFAQYQRYQARLGLNDLEGSVNNGKKAVELSRDGDPDNAKWMNNLGLAYKAQFRNSADISLLQMATRSFEEAVTLSPKDSKISWLALNNLADAFGLTFEWTRETEALNIAVSNYRELASRIETTNKIEWADSLKNFGHILLCAYARYYRRELLNEAVEALSRALEKYPRDHIDSAAAHSLLCLILTILYRDSKLDQKKGVDIQEAIKHGILSIQEGITNVSREPIHRHNLSEAYLIKWDENGRKDYDDLAKAMTHSEIGLDATLADDPDRVTYLIHHNKLLILKILQDGVEGDARSFDKPLKLLKEAMSLPSGLPLTQIIAARQAIRILSEQSRWEEAKSIGLDAMKLLPMVCGRYLSVQDQQQAISQTSGFAAEICSLLIRAGEPEEALRQLEAGRAMLLWFAMDNSDELSTLAESPQHKSLAKEFMDARSKLHIPPHLQGSRLGELKLRKKWAAEVDLTNCLRKIREIDGYHDFLSEPPMDQIKSGSQKGPIVMVNVSYISSDAIVLIDSNVRVVPLPGLQLEKAVDYGIQTISSFSLVNLPVQRAAEVLSMKIPKQSGQKSSSFLHWLWTHCNAG
ncbi:hypothetical protein THARTR1_09553 [Trichoderma harzianum]|uniref:CHAT domain-containing protein n=1 Tax=Trichoderma harzianum TaxID=5544 RepID=A0A2K0TW70_TRIHA|nr:hypothetical protein THARTR1_09553 [Trichoderma harzianum]